MIIQETLEIEHSTIDADPEIVQRNIKLARERILRSLDQLIGISVENRIKDGRAIKKITVTFEP